MSDIDRLAELVGIEPFYFDIWGNRRDTSRETKCALLAAMGVGVGSEAEVAGSLREAEERPWRRLLPPVLVVLEGEEPQVPVAVPEDAADAVLRWTLIGETGAEHRGEVRLGDLPDRGGRTIDGRGYRRRALALPLRPGLGYHRLEVDLGGVGRAGMRLIVAPERCVMPEEVLDGGRTWGIGIQLYSLRSRSDWGIGDFDDLGAFAETAAGLGAGLVGLNPLHALFPADPNHYGPYSPSSRRFLNILCIDVEAVPGFASCARAQELVGDAAFRARLGAARAAELVDYPAVSALKLPVLEALFESNRNDDGFARFRAQMGDALHRHAVFEALHEHFLHGQGLWMWQDWPQEYRDADGPAVAAFAADRADRVTFFAWLQWEADRQLGVAAERGRRAGLALGFYRDLAVAVNPGGAATWSDPAVLIQGANVGAPPDAFNMKGQNWGLSPLSPLGLTETAYEGFIAAVRASMRHAGALRIDHAMALQHLFWIPRTGEDGAYVAYPLDDLLRIIALESRRNRCVVIGEDLGTVPEGFRPALQKAGILSYRVLYFERGKDGTFTPPARYPEQAMVVVTTHDLPTFRGFWTGRDQEWRSGLDLFPDAKARERDVWERGVDRWRLLQALGSEGLRPATHPTDEGGQPWTPELAVAAHRFIARSPGRIVMLQAEDALADAEQPNLPGTIDQHPNWRRRLSRTVEEFADDPGVRMLAGAFASVSNGS